ncbi:MAG: response regulator [Planctomycetota bacterium]|jgi:CheY-like chemotaxis protein
MENAKILIVDDDQDIRQSLQVILENQKYTVFTASDPVEGMEQVKAINPNLIILDVIMTTWEDGFEMARTLKKEPDSQKIPILMFTGVKDKTGIDFKPTAGDSEWCPVDAFLDKPVEPDILIKEVEKLLSE